MQPFSSLKTFYRFTSSSGWETIESKIITEATVSLTVNGEIWLTFMCTPTNLEELAVGFLYNEEIIQSINEVASIRVCENGLNVDVWLRHAVEKPVQWRKTSGCTGGITRLDTESSMLPFPLSDQLLTPESLLNGMDQLIEVQDLYREVRGVHCSALSDGSEIRLMAEDIGRHNTLDKLIGLIMLGKFDVNPKIVMTTGRISSEMLQKSARIGASVVVSRTSATSLSVEMAEQLGITLVGYARRNQFLIYSHPERISYPTPFTSPMKKES